MKSWVLWGACFLAWQAAFINVIFLLLTGASVSHMTGDYSRLMADLASGDFESKHWILMGVALFGFISGATVSGFRLSKNHSSWRLFSKSFLTMFVLMYFSYALIADHILIAILLSGMVCGMQNGLAKEHRGIILRSTHLTGTFTDVGVLLGRKLRGEDVGVWKIQILSFLVLFFSLGGISGSIAWALWKENSLLIPTAGYLLSIVFLKVYLMRASNLK